MLELVCFARPSSNPRLGQDACQWSVSFAFNSSPVRLQLSQLSSSCNAQLTKTMSNSQSIHRHHKRQASSSDSPTAGVYSLPFTLAPCLGCAHACHSTDGATCPSPFPRRFFPSTHHHALYTHYYSLIFSFQDLQHPLQRLLPRYRTHLPLTILHRLRPFQIHRCQTLNLLQRPLPLQNLL